ncbi:MAG: hypothetical protein LCH81_14575 [Bacteroidetes bacterium]|nr:hypothetical protein [Bacteroidota bacterium]
MKQILMYTWIIAILGQAFVRTAWTVDYWWHQDKYVSNCENLYNVRFDCAGKCYLNKTVRTSEGATSSSGKEQSPLTQMQFKDAVLYFEAFEMLPDVPVLRTEKLPVPPYSAFAPTVPEAPVFKPPGTSLA